MCDTKYFIVTLNFHQQHLKHDLPHFAYIREVKKKTRSGFYVLMKPDFFAIYQK